MSRYTLERALAATRSALWATAALWCGCRAESAPDVPATVGPFFPVTGSDAVEPSLDGAISVEDEEPSGSQDAARNDDMAPAAHDLPCDVGNLLRARCARCHGAPPLAGVPISLLTYADLMAPAKGQPGVSNAERALLRVQMDTMPPGGGLSSEEIAVLARWVTAGARPDRCDTGAPATSAEPPISVLDASIKDAGPLDAGAHDAGRDVADVSTPAAQDAGAADDAASEGGAAASGCTSQSRWAGGDAGSALMSPGTACLGCHGARAPVFTFAGSIYASAHEPDQCNGVAANDALLLIKAANGFKLALTINAAGNFFTQTSLPKPYTVELRYQGRVVTKQEPQTSGDCNACHSEAGGRITLP
jgi:hypothetical protein